MKSNIILEKSEVKPFLKWAGGKRWFVKDHSHYLPQTFQNYIEPFLGSGAVFFHLAPKKGILSDYNSDLINSYLAIESNWERVFRVLKKHQKNHSKDYYYRIRAQESSNDFVRAANFIYLNRTCFNGIYRVNLNGKFNVPKGTKNSVIFEDESFESISLRLRGIKILNQDFEISIDQACAGDFLFIDPPYTVKHNENGFIKYNEKLFSWEDQVRLKDAAVRALSRGAKVFITNAHHPSIKYLYRKAFKLKTLSRSNVIASDPRNRGVYEEYLIMGR